MVKQVNLINYLPPFMAEYREISETLSAETPEFILTWKAVDRTLKNMFIESADEYGISRFEKLLGISPNATDTLENRRERVSIRWFNELPFTFKALLEKLIAICSDGNFSIICNFKEAYEISVTLDLSLQNKVKEVENILDTMLPMNLLPNRWYTHSEKPELQLYTGIVYILVREHTFSCEEESISSINCYTDENKNILLDELGNILTD